MSKFAPISGFPEWLPEQRLLEQQCLDTIRRQYELYGFANIETRSVEPTRTYGTATIKKSTCWRVCMRKPGPKRPRLACAST
jgi:histidyl-tRNA synthetase